MNPLSLLEKLKTKIASIGFKLFIWGNGTTKEKYWGEIYHQERIYKESANHFPKINQP